MHIRLILILLAGLALYLMLRHLAGLPQAQRRRIVKLGALGLLTATLIGLVVSGRLPWLFALLGAAIPVAQKLLVMLWRYAPILRQLLRYLRDRSGR
jgi:hypothetical protein